MIHGEMRQECTSRIWQEQMPSQHRGFRSTQRACKTLSSYSKLTMYSWGGEGMAICPQFSSSFHGRNVLPLVMQTSPEHNHVGMEEVWWVWVSSHFMIVPSSSSLLHLFLSSTILECPILFSLLPCLSSLLLGSLIWAQDCAHCDHFSCQPDRI